MRVSSCLRFGFLRTPLSELLAPPTDKTHFCGVWVWDPGFASLVVRLQSSKFVEANCTSQTSASWFASALFTLTCVRHITQLIISVIVRPAMPYAGRLAVCDCCTTHGARNSRATNQWRCIRMGPVWRERDQLDRLPKKTCSRSALQLTRWK